MKTAAKDRITIKLFAGFPLTSELRMHLKGSKTWNQAQIQPELQPLVEAHHDQQTYLGRFITNVPVTLRELCALEQELRLAFLTYCPKFPADKLQLITFSQVFIA